MSPYRPLHEERAWSRNNASSPTVGQASRPRVPLFALHLAGYRDIALYDASWEEWGTDPAFLVEREGG